MEVNFQLRILQGSSPRRSPRFNRSGGVNLPIRASSHTRKTYWSGLTIGKRPTQRTRAAWATLFSGIALPLPPSVFVRPTVNIRPAKSICPHTSVRISFFRRAVLRARETTVRSKGPTLPAVPSQYSCFRGPQMVLSNYCPYRRLPRCITQVESNRGCACLWPRTALACHM
jgi:hypothetical protein